MFWIGMLVGIVIGLMLAGALGYRYYKWLCQEFNCDLDDLAELGAAGMEAFTNRESRLIVVHDNETIFETVFEEE